MHWQAIRVEMNIQYRLENIALLDMVKALSHISGSKDRLIHGIDITVLPSGKRLLGPYLTLCTWMNSRLVRYLNIKRETTGEFNYNLRVI